MKYDSRLISKPQDQRPLWRTAWGFVTAAFWAFCFYLWAPLVTFVLWLFGIRTGWDELYAPESQLDPFVLVVLPLIAIGCAALLIAWAEYNRFRFRRKDRRQPRPDTPPSLIARMLGAEPAIASALRAGKVIFLHMDQQARPLRYELQAT